LFRTSPKEFAMKPFTSITTATALAAALALSAAAAQAGSTPSSSTDPGFVPQTGQINPGEAPHPWSATAELPQDKQPPQDQARAALMMPDPVGVSSLGEPPAQASGNQTTIGAASTPAEQSGAAAAPAAPPGPIGATLQTMPAKVSQRNDLLDHLPMMAWPLRLDQQQRQQIYQAVMADKSQPAANADTLKPAASLSYDQQRDMHPLPQALAGIDGLQGLHYVKGKDKVLLVRPSNGIVVDQINM
jgi:hypothetical protein